MINLNFDSTLLVAIFAQATAGSQPTQEALTRFDAALQRNNEPNLTAIMRSKGIVPDKLSRAKVLAYMPNVPGDTPDMQIANACDYHLAAEAALGNTPAVFSAPTGP
jgi:hypothetical protein